MSTENEETLYNQLSYGCYERRLFAYMAASGIGKITVSYSGGGDSGCVDEIWVYDGDGKMIDGCNPEWIDSEENLSEPIWDKHGSFADGGGYFVSGSVKWDAINRTVELSGVDYTDVDDGEDSDEDGDREQIEESWSDMLYENDEECSDSERNVFDCHFLLLHCKGKPMPKALHTRLLAEAIADPKNVELVEYMRTCTK